MARMRCLQLGLHEGVFTRKTARQSCLFNVAVYAAAVHCEVMQFEEAPIARRAKIARGMSCRTKASSLVARPLQVPDTRSALHQNNPGLCVLFIKGLDYYEAVLKLLVLYFKKIGTFVVWYGYGLIWSVVKVNFVMNRHSWKVTILLFEDASWLNFSSCIYVMCVCKLYLILTHLLPHITCFASNLRHESFKFSYPKNCFIMKLSVALKTCYEANKGN